MNKKPIIIVVVLGALFIVGYLVFRVLTTPAEKSNARITPQTNVQEIRKVDLSTQPEWVQKLVVTATSGRSANGLRNFTIKADGIPATEVESVEYVIQYETTNKGAQGALATKPVEINGATSFVKTIDLGTCSTKSCVTHDGVTMVDAELNFNTKSGSQVTWTGTVNIK